MAESRKVPETEQRSFAFPDELPATEGRPGKEEVQAPPNFLSPSPERLFIGEVALRDYLIGNGFGWVVRLREWIVQSDLSPFLSAYKGQGRKAVHPSILLGLIAYGMLQRQWSLRDLEKLARRDVGAWWLCGGLQPDHSTIGNFINKHAEVLTEIYFVSLTKRLVRELNLSVTEVAGDGTVVEACGSRFKNLKAEALREAARKAREEAKRNPQDAKAVAKAESLEQASNVAQERQEKAEAKGRNDIRVCLTEPEAVVQPLKNKARRPSYKPSVLANRQRFLVGQGVDPSKETAMLQPMMNQHEGIFHSLPEAVLLDGSYNTLGVLDWAVTLDLDVLCPANREEDGASTEKSSDKRGLPKSAFSYDEQTDTYLCPAGHRLRKRGGVHVQQGRRVEKYRCDLPVECPYREQCTKSPQGRTILRYEDEPLKEAMRKVLEHPEAKKRSRRRKWMVEPVFSSLQNQQGLRKFHRRGLKKVRIEFSLHCIAYYLGRALRLESQALGLFLCLCSARKGNRSTFFFLLLVVHGPT